MRSLISKRMFSLGKVAKRRQIRKSMHAQILILTKFDSMTKFLASNKIGIFRVRFIAIPSVEFSKICWIVKHICALLSS